jgi:hypothetical protein
MNHDIDGPLRRLNKHCVQLKQIAHLAAAVRLQVCGQSHDWHDAIAMHSINHSCNSGLTQIAEGAQFDHSRLCYIRGAPESARLAIGQEGLY